MVLPHTAADEEKVGRTDEGWGGARMVSDTMGAGLSVESGVVRRISACIDLRLVQDMFFRFVAQDLGWRRSLAR